VCVSEATFVANIVRIYPNTTFLKWKPGMVLPPVYFVFCSQWLPPLSNKIWHCEVLEAFWRRPRSLDLPRPGDGKASLFPPSTLTWVDVIILLELLGLLSGRHLGWWI
jgi:hypothetical protein